MKTPVVFLSSFYQENLYGSDRHGSPLWQLRQRLWAEHSDPDYEGESAIWVAEKSNRPLFDNPDRLAVVDELVAVLLRSEIYVCILADARHDEFDHGSAVEVGARLTATSYLEVELYAAAMHRKPIRLFVLKGFDPGKRLQSLLDILEWALPDWASKEPQPADEIQSEITEMVRGRSRFDATAKMPLRQRLVSGLYAQRGQLAPPGKESKGVLFLDGLFERRAEPPQKDLVEDLIAKCEQVPSMQQKLNRIWIAIRELMSASYRPDDVMADSRLRDFLPLWNRALSLWSSAAAWSGFHGHLYAGVIAPLNSLTLIRQSFTTADRQKFPLDVWGTPYGALASAHYSVGKLLPFGLPRFVNLRRALIYVHWSMADSKRLTGSITPGELAVRGSIRLQFGDNFGSLRDFRRMIQLREKEGADETQMGLEFMHLGLGYAGVGRLWKARGELERSVRILSPAVHDPNLPRAERHLARLYALTGKKAAAAQMRETARRHASQLDAMDQFR